MPSSFIMWSIPYQAHQFFYKLVKVISTCGIYIRQLLMGKKQLLFITLKEFVLLLSNRLGLCMIWHMTTKLQYDLESPFCSHANISSIAQRILLHLHDLLLTKISFPSFYVKVTKTYQQCPFNGFGTFCHFYTFLQVLTTWADRRYTSRWLDEFYTALKSISFWSLHTTKVFEYLYFTSFAQHQDNWVKPFLTSVAPLIQ